MLSDSVTTLLHLLDDDSEELFDSYVHDSLIAEREMLKTIKSMRAERGKELPIERRTESSIIRRAEAAGVKVEEIPSRKDVNWPGAEERATHLGPTAYVGYRAGSSAIHGTWEDLQRNYVTQVDGGFQGRFEPLAPRPQPLFAAAILVTKSAIQYLGRLKTSQDVSEVRDRLKDLQARTSKADALHEAFLNQ